MFLFFAFVSTQIANTSAGQPSSTDTTISQVPNTSLLLYIALAFGFSLAVNVWVFYRVSGGLFNPAVSFPFILEVAIKLIQMILGDCSTVAGQGNYLGSCYRNIHSSVNWSHCSRWCCISHSPRSSQRGNQFGTSH
jgi:glycerol uptake facilitator-like aquaporin